MDTVPLAVSSAKDSKSGREKFYMEYLERVILDLIKPLKAPQKILGQK